MLDERLTGTVKWFDEKKGFGFIERDEGDDVFVHYTSLRDDSGFRTLEDGQKVEFDVKEAEKGPQAEDVVKL